MDTELLKTFLELEKTRHFGRAADRLYLTQAAVSSRIRQLEHSVGATLFVRHRNNLGLTAAGERLKPHAETILSALSRGLTEVAEALRPQQTLRVAATPQVWDGYLYEQLPQLTAALVNAVPRLDVLNREQLVQALIARRCDLGLFFDPPKVEELRPRKLGDLRFYWVQATRPPTDANTPSYVQVDWHRGLNAPLPQWEEAFALPRAVVGSCQMALRLLLTGGGFSLLPEALCAPAIAGGSLRQIDDAPMVTRTLYAAHLLRPDHRELLEQLLQQLGKPTL